MLQAWKLGWIAGSLTFSICLYWVAYPVHMFGSLPLILAIPCPILLGFYLGLYPSVFVMSLYWARQRLSWWTTGVFAAVLWIFLDFIRSTIFSGFPWLTISQAFSPWPVAIQSVKFIGAFGLSGILVMFSTWLALGKNNKTALAWAALILIVLSIYGLWSMKQPLPKNSKFSVSIIQGNIEQDLKWDSRYQNNTVNTYLKMSKKSIRNHSPKLLIWPETAMPFYLQEDSKLSRKVRNFVQKNNIFLLTGAPGYSSSQGDYQLYNRAYLLSPQGNIIDMYEKEHLVPFGEYVPLKKIFPFLDKLVVGVSDFSSGTQVDPLNLNNLALGTLICYEIIFPYLGQKRVVNGTNCFVNLSNDAWFGNTSAPFQHLNQAILRTVEHNRYLIRSTNTGISAIVDTKGKIKTKSDLFKPKILYYDKVYSIQKKSFFAKNYQIIQLIFIILLFSIFMKACLKSK